jgi:alcohol dehydrogenase
MKMRALVYHGPHQLVLEEKNRPVLVSTTDAIVRITTTTLCGTDLHILNGDVPTIADGRILGHEGIGIVVETGSEVKNIHPGDKVLISLITACGRCRLCKKGLFSHCSEGGWLLGNSIDGTQAEFVRIPYADNGLYLLPPDADDDAMVLLSCNLPTAMECGTLNGQVKPGDRVAIVGAGPVGLAILLTSRLYSPAQIIMLDQDDNRLNTAHNLGANHIVNTSHGSATEQVMALTQGAGVDVAIEAVGIAATFDICQAIIAVGGRIANVGVHGKPVELHLEKLWSSNITLTTCLVNANTTPLLLQMIQAKHLDVKPLVSHRFELSQIMQAYQTFQNAAQQHALKVLIHNDMSV